MLSRRAHVAIFDRFGDPVCTLKGERSDVDRLAADVERFTRYRGPVTLRPTIWLISGGRIAELTGGDMIEATTALHDPDDPNEVILVGKKT